MKMRGMVAVVAACALTSSLQAADLFWDLNGTTSGAGVTATSTTNWDTTLLNWNTVADGTGSTIAWTSGNVARFSAGTDSNVAFTVNLSAAQTVGGLIVEEGTVSFTGSAITLGTNTLRVDSGAKFSIPSSTNLSASAGAIVSLQGGTFRSTVNGAGSTFLSSNATIQIGSLGGTVETANTGTNSSIYAGTITGVGNVLTKTGTGEFRYQGTGLPNTTFSKLVVNQGLYRLGFASSISDERGFGAVPASFLADAITLSGGGAIGTSFTAANSVLHANRGITLGTGGGEINGNMTIPGAITGAGSLSRLTTGTLVLQGNSDYTGTTFVTAGIISVQNANALGSTSAGTEVAAGGEVLFTGAAQTFTINEPFKIAGAGGSDGGAIAVISTASPTIAGPVTLTADATVTVSSSASATFSNANAFTGSNFNLTITGGANATGTKAITGAINLGTGGITKNQGGTWILGGNNNYGGATSITAGALNIQHANALGTIVGGTTVASGAALQTQGTFVTAAEPLTISGTGLSATGALRHISGNVDFTGPLTLGAASRINSDAGLLTLSNTAAITGTGFGLTVGGAGNVDISSPIATGTGGLTKDGTGTLRLLSSLNTFTGATLISAGTLTIANAATLNSTTVTVQTGGVLRNDGLIAGAVQVDSGGSLQGIGSVGSLNVAGTIAPGNSAGKLTVVGALTLTDTANTNMEIFNPGTAGTDYDTISAGSVAYEGQLNVSFDAGGTFGAGNSFNLFDGTPGSSDFNSIALTGAFSGSLLSLGSGLWSSDTILNGAGLTFLFDGATGVLQINAQAVPEPLVAGGVLLLVSRVAGRRSRVSL